MTRVLRNERAAISLARSKMRVRPIPGAPCTKQTLTLREPNARSMLACTLCSALS